MTCSVCLVKTEVFHRTDDRVFCRDCFRFYDLGRRLAAERDERRFLDAIAAVDYPVDDRDLPV